MNLRIVRWIDIYVGIPLAYLVFCLKKIFRQDNHFNARDDYKKILFVKFWGVGNVIMLLPAVHALRQRYPDAKIGFLTLFSNKEVSQLAGVFDNIYILDTNSLIKFIITSLKAFSLLRKRNYDLIIDFEQFARFSALTCSLIGRRNTIGFNTKGQHRHFLYTNPIPYNNNIHITKSFYQLAESAGAVHKDYLRSISVIYQQDDICQMQVLLGKRGISPQDVIIIIHAGTSMNFSLRRWPIEYFADLADRLIENFGVRIIFTGLCQEVSLIEKAISYIKNKRMVVNASGKFNFYQFVSLIKLSDLLISTDTAPVHIATCLSVSVVGLYGPNTPLLYGPWGDRSIWFYKPLDCSPCITNYNAKISKCRHPAGKGTCMKRISVDEVFSGIKNNYFDTNAQFKLKKIHSHE